MQVSVVRVSVNRKFIPYRQLKHVVDTIRSAQPFLKCFVHRFFTLCASSVIQGSLICFWVEENEHNNSISSRIKSLPFGEFEGHRADIVFSF